MIVSSFQKVALCSFFISFSLNGMEAGLRIVSQIDGLYTRKVNSSLKQLVTKADADPHDFFSAVTDYYHTQPSNRTTVTAYCASPWLNLKKAATYVNLRRSTNKDQYLPRAKAILGKINSEDAPKAFGPDDYSKYRDHLFNQLGQDDPAATQEVQTRMSQEWPLVSVLFDLKAQKAALEGIKRAFIIAQDALFLVETTDTKITRTSQRIEKDLETTTQAIALLEQRKEIEEICKDPVPYIAELAHLGSLSQIAHNFPLGAINALFKKSNAQGNGLLHELCVTPLLTPEQQQEVVTVLTEHDGIHINEHNRSDQTPLDCVLSKNPAHPIIPFLVSQGAEKALPFQNKRFSSGSPQGSPTHPRKKVGLPSAFAKATSDRQARHPIK